MKPEFQSRRLLGITRSKEKMYEFHIPEEFHLHIPEGNESSELFILTIGILGDVAAFINDNRELNFKNLPNDLQENLLFSAKFFDAFIGARFNTEIDKKVILLASAAYYLGGRPGSSLVMANRIFLGDFSNPLEKLLLFTLLMPWSSNQPLPDHSIYGYSYFKIAIDNIHIALSNHFSQGQSIENLTGWLGILRTHAYQKGSASDLLLADLIVAVIYLKVSASTWRKLPEFTGLSTELWHEIIQKKEFTKEFWPSQLKIGEAGLFSGKSGIIQMPTSAGKTRSVEIILQSAFLSKRTKLAVIVAPFKALCHEIASSLRVSFQYTDVRVNEVSDALQLDIFENISNALGQELFSSKYLLILTPEKLLYILRHVPEIAKHIGALIYDEGHQFDSGSRGITYELLLTEIKNLLSSNTQIILVSAVIQNALEIGRWLIGEEVQIVDGTKLLSTSRAISFMSWLEKRGGKLYFFEKDSFNEYDYFVPKIIEVYPLKKLKREKKERLFPHKESINDIALYLGIRMASSGPVAIFNGRKETAYNIIKRSVEIYNRNIELLPPSSYSDTDEIYRLTNLISLHFGSNSILAKAANKGLFLHHGTTPQGLRLAIEYAMQKKLIKFISCTSTLSQGVNLPIRYLIVTSIYQAGEKIKVRDFQNLIGRAGRSGMHTEGLIIFADNTLYDNRKNNEKSWKFKNSVELLKPELSENISSTLLELILPIESQKKYNGQPYILDLPVELYTIDETRCIEWIDSIYKTYSHFFTLEEIKNNVFKRRNFITTVESYLMASRDDKNSQEFIDSSKYLAEQTLAYHLADELMKLKLKELFTNITTSILQKETNSIKQAIYGKTLLGIDSAKIIENWVENNRSILLNLQNNDQWLLNLWPIFKSLVKCKFLNKTLPGNLAYEVALKWLKGETYQSMMEYINQQQGKIAHGKEFRKIKDDDILKFLENTLCFESGLILAAVSQFLHGDLPPTDDPILFFQKALKYGLPNYLSIVIYEKGFSDRVIAQYLASYFDKQSTINPILLFKHKLKKSEKDSLKVFLSQFPTYFEHILNTL